MILFASTIPSFQRSRCVLAFDITVGICEELGALKTNNNLGGCNFNE